VFIIPYVLWYFYIVATFLYIFFTSKSEFWKYCALLFGGMTVCLAIFTVFPNGQNMRPDFDSLGRSNFLLDVVKYLHSIDTCTNVLPSIHVYNSIATHIAIVHSEKLKKNKFIRWTSALLCISICLSTVFLKQHSILDGIAAIVLIAILYFIINRKIFSNKTVTANSL
jgi:membrane-associated phospholipid phosphatase